MFCANCGTKQNEGEKFCPNCGTKFEEPLKVEVTKFEEVSRSEASKPENIVSENVDDKVQIKVQITKEEESISILNEESDSIIEIDSTKDKGTKVETNEPTRTLKPEEYKVIQKENIEETNINVGNKDLESENITKNTVKNECKNTFSPQVEDNKELNELICEADKGNVEAQMRLAVKYELGLGIPVDIVKAEQLYAQIENRTKLLCKLYPQKCIEERTGIISDSINVEYNTFYDPTKDWELKRKEPMNS